MALSLCTRGGNNNYYYRREYYSREGTECSRACRREYYTREYRREYSRASRGSALSVQCPPSIDSRGSGAQCHRGGRRAQDGAPLEPPRLPSV